MATTEIDVLETRLTRVEQTLRAIERRLGALEREPAPERTVSPVEEAPPLFDFALIGRSVLIVGGAFLLRALTETGLVPQRVGAVAAFFYSLAWMAIAGRGLAQGRPLRAVYDSLTAALIAGPLIWEATTRFHVFTPPVASLFLAIAAMALFIIAVRWQITAVAWIAAAMTTLTAIGLSAGTGDLVPTAMASTIVGVVALRLRIEALVKLLLAIVSDFLLLALIAMTGLERTPYPFWSVEVALLSMAVLWIGVIELNPQWPGPVQTAAVMIIAGGGASLLAFDASVLAMLWSIVALVTAAIGRRFQRPQWSLQAPIWIVAATIAAFTAGARSMLLLAGLTALAVFVLLPIEAAISRFVVLAAMTLTALVSANWLLMTTDPAVLAMERSIVLALAAVLLALRGAVWREAAMMARLVLAFAALKFLIDDFRTGRALTIFAALAAYGLAMVIIARRSIVKENA